jgi:ribonuclease D
MRSATSPISSEDLPAHARKLRKTGRGAWLDQEMERLADPANYVNDPDLAWTRIKPAEPQARGARPPEGDRRLARARGAVKKNLPRGRIAKDETLADLASHPPRFRAISPRSAACRRELGGNDIGARLMGAIARRRLCPKPKCRRARIASPVLARKAR